MLTALLSLFTSFMPLKTDSSSLLWKISGNGLKQPSYLFGTIHLLCESEFPRTTSLEQAIKNTQSFYMEFNMNDPTAMQKLAAGVIMPDNYSFKSLLPESDYRLLKNYFMDSLSIPLESLDHVKPMAILSLLLSKTVSCTSTPVQCENILLGMVKEHGHTIGGLESVEDELAVFDSIPDKEEAATLVKMVQDMSGPKEEYDQLLSAYRSHNIEQLYQLITEEEDIKKYKPLLLDNRNHHWIPVICKQIAQTPTFIAVGAGHLGGREGIISLLKAKGYKVEPVAL